MHPEVSVASSILIGRQYSRAPGEVFIQIEIIDPSPDIENNVLAELKNIFDIAAEFVRNEYGRNRGSLQAD